MIRPLVLASLLGAVAPRTDGCHAGVAPPSPVHYDPADDLILADPPVGDAVVAEPLVAGARSEGVAECASIEPDALRQAQIKYCYEVALQGDGQLKGDVSVAWTVADGGVRDVRILENTTGSSALADCIVRKTKRWTYPPCTDLGRRQAYRFVTRFE